MAATAYNEAMADLLMTYSYLLLFAALLLEATVIVGVFFPGVGILVSAGFLAGTGHLSFSGVLLVAWTGVTLGDNAGYLLGRLGSKRSSRIRRLVAGTRPEMLQRWSAMFYQFALPTRATFPIVAGALGMSFRSWSMLNGAATSLFVITVAGVGFAVGKVAGSVHDAEAWARYIQVAFASLFLLWVLHFVRHLWRRRPVRAVSEEATLSVIQQSAPGLTCKTEWFEREGVQLRILHLTSDASTGLPIVFVPGWASSLFTWRYFLPELLASGPVYYFETREKSSASAGISDSFGINALRDDLSAYLEEGQFDREYAVVGASSGANLIIESLAMEVHRPDWVVLMLPHRRMPVPSYIRTLYAVPRSALPLVRKILAFFVKRSVMPKRLIAQREGMLASLDCADLSRLRASASAWRTYRLDVSKLGRITSPTLTVGAHNDPIHDVRAAREVHAGLPHGAWYDAGTFVGAHSSRTARHVTRWATRVVEEEGD